jgi:hypothetical protein
MKRILYVVSLLFLMLFSMINRLMAQKEVSVDPFDEIAVAGNIHVYLEPGDKEKLVLYIEGIPESEVHVKVIQGALRISVLNSFVYKNEIIKAYVTYKQLRTIRSNAGASIESKAVLSGDKLDVHVGSGANLNLDVKANALDASAGEGGQLNLGGTVESLNVGVSTGGQCHCTNLEAKRAYVKAGTGGRAEVNAIDLLETSANLGGEIYYSVDPKEKRIKSFLGGNVQKMGASSSPSGKKQN